MSRKTMQNASHSLLLLVQQPAVIFYTHALCVPGMRQTFLITHTQTIYTQDKQLERSIEVKA